MIEGVTLFCPRCTKVVSKTTPNAEKIHGKVWLRKGENVYVVCKSCNAEIKLPFRVVDDTVDAGPRLYLDK